MQGALAAAMIVVASTAGAQDIRLRNRLDAATATRVGAIIDSARFDGLPTRPLTSKALEGASKGAPGPRIVAAVSRLAGELRTARDVLGPASESELDAAASALIYFRRGDVIADVTVPTVVGTLIGSSAAAVLGHRVHQVFIRYVFVILITYLAVEMVRRGIAAS